MQDGERSEGVRRLTRDTENAVLCGVAAGIGDYLGIDPVLVRSGSWRPRSSTVSA